MMVLGQGHCVVFLWSLNNSCGRAIEGCRKISVKTAITRNLSCLYPNQRKPYDDYLTRKGSFQKRLRQSSENGNIVKCLQSLDRNEPSHSPDNSSSRTAIHSDSRTWSNISKLKSLLQLQKKKLTLQGGSLFSLQRGNRACSCRTSRPDIRRQMHTWRYCGSLPFTCVRKHPPWRILFFGTDELSVSSLRALQENRNSLVSCVSDLDVITNHRQTAVRRYAQEQNLRVLDWPLSVDTESYDVGVLVSFGKMIPAKIINMFPYGIINIHPSVLPHWRGASPIIHTILNGETETGVSVMDLRPKHFDMGPILMQRRVPVPPRMTSYQLSLYLQPVMSDILLQSLENLPRLEKYEHEQEDRGVTYAHKIMTVNTLIDWDNSTAEDVDRQYRAFGEQMSLRTSWKGHTVKLHKMVDPKILEDLDLQYLRPQPNDLARFDPGSPFFHKGGKCIIIKCKEGCVGFREIVLKKTISPQSFYNGYVHKAENKGVTFTSHKNFLNCYHDSEKIPAQLIL